MIGVVIAPSRDMRLALLVAFVGSLVFAPAAVEARPGKTTSASKQKASKKATKKKVVEEDAPTIEEDTKPVAAKAETHRTGASVAQASDDEVPRNEPGKKRR